jgi:hypothetical protein
MMPTPGTDCFLQERTKALQALEEADRDNPTANVNELHIELIRCMGIKARREGRVFLYLHFCRKLADILFHFFRPSVANHNATITNFML